MNTAERLAIVVVGTGVWVVGAALAPAAPRPEPKKETSPAQAEDRQRPAPASSDAPAAPQRRRNTAPPEAAMAQVVMGQVLAFDEGRSLTVEIRRRGGMSQKTEFKIARDKSVIELRGDVKAIAVGVTVSVWADKDDPKLAARIVAGTNPMSRPRNARPGNAAMPARPNMPPPDIATATVSTAVSTAPPRQPVAGLAAADVARQIDKHIETRLAAEKLVVSPVCDDAEFLRRVYLDVIGVIPPGDKVAAFLDDPAPNKRATLVDELLASPEYGPHFADLWCDRIDVKDMPIYREPFIGWMSDRFNKGRGWNEIVFDLLTAEGRFNFITRGKRLASTEPQALFMLLNTEDVQGGGKPNPAWLAAESGRLFLGVQLQCAECHNHPFTDSWRQTDFWGLAAFFGQLGATRGAGNAGLQWTEAHVPANETVKIAIPPTALKNVGEIVPARLLGSDQPYQPSDQQSLRQALARWLTAADNPYFAQAAVNRLWADFFGRGLVNPVNDLRPDNPASHPEVLALLAEEFKKSQFDQKHLIRCLCLSRAYQRTSAPLPENEQDQLNYSHMAIKILGPGVFYDSLKRATGFPEMKVGLPERKTKLTVISQFTPREVFVDFFRSNQGEEADPLDNLHGLPQALKLMNAVQLNGVAPTVQRLAETAQDPGKVITGLYLAALARRPTPAEAKLMTDFLAQRNDSDPYQGYSAVMWALVNSAEFVSNH